MVPSLHQLMELPFCLIPERVQPLVRSEQEDSWGLERVQVCMSGHPLIVDVYLEHILIVVFLGGVSIARVCASYVNGADDVHLELFYGI